MRKLTYILLLILIGTNASAQSNIRINDYWDNLYSINPAAINNQYGAIISIADRQQWAGVEGAPNTVFASASTFIEKLHTQLGAKVYKDKIGYTSTTNVGLSYAYAVTLDASWTLNLGLSGNLHSLSYDASRIKLETSDDPMAYQILQNSNEFNAETGIELVSKPWRFGASCQNLFSLFSGSKNKQFPYSNFLYARYRNYNTSLFDHSYSVCGIQTGNLYQGEFMASAYLKNYEQEDLFQFSLFYRTMNEMGTILGVNLGKTMSLSYSFDFNVSGISRGSVGTHELMLTLKLNKIEFCRCNQY